MNSNMKSRKLEDKIQKVSIEKSKESIELKKSLVEARIALEVRGIRKTKYCSELKKRITAGNKATKRIISIPSQQKLIILYSNIKKTFKK